MLGFCDSQIFKGMEMLPLLSLFFFSPESFTINPANECVSRQQLKYILPLPFSNTRVKIRHIEYEA